jgi:sec-independent protein translocase protein TatA
MGLDNPLHIAFLLILLLLVFGAKRLPEMGQSLGSGMRGFKDALSGDSQQHSLVAQHQQEAAAAAPASIPLVAPVALDAQHAAQPVSERIPA